MKNNLKTAVLLAGIGGLLVVLGGLLGSTTGAIIGFTLGMAFVGGSYWFSDKLAIRAARAVEVTPEQMPRYHAIVADLAQRADIPMPRLYVSPDPQPNAFATGRNPANAAVCVNKGILDVLTWEELQGVLAHEISHVRNRDILISSVAAAVAMGITLLASIARFGAIFGGGGRPRRQRDRRARPVDLGAHGGRRAADGAQPQSGVRGRSSGCSTPRHRRAAGLGAREARPRHPGRAGDGAARPGRRLHRQPARRWSRAVRQPVHHPPAHGRSDPPPPQRRVAQLSCPADLGSPDSRRRPARWRCPAPSTRAGHRRPGSGAALSLGSC
ncbi:MAG: M48 family metalloprotease [Acidimicrobiales bacterium]